jgi:hypothetical protein
LETEARTQSIAPTEWNNEPNGGRASHPSFLKGREEVLDELRSFVLDTPSIALTIQGPRGAGTSALAREAVGMARGHFTNSVAIHVDVSQQKAPSGDPSHGVAVALLQHFQPDVQVQGSSTNRIMGWFLRRILVGARPVVVWLDQLRPNVRTMAGVLGPLMDPGTLVGDVGRFPPVFLILSGSGSAGLNGNAVHIHVPLLPVGTVREIVEDRARQSGRVFAPDALAKTMDILATRGNSLSVMEEILQAAIQKAGCHGIIVEEDVIAPATVERARVNRQVAELRVLEVLRRAGGQLAIGELVRVLARSFASEEHVPSAGTVRRWLVKLQALGLVKRQVSQGGDGGTMSVVSLT